MKWPGDKGEARRGATTQETPIRRTRWVRLRPQGSGPFGCVERRGFGRIGGVQAVVWQGLWGREVTWQATPIRARGSTQCGVDRPFSRRQGTPRERPRARVCEASEQPMLRHRPGEWRHPCRDLLAGDWRGSGQRRGKARNEPITRATRINSCAESGTGQGTWPLTLERLLSPDQRVRGRAAGAIGQGC